MKSDFSGEYVLDRPACVLSAAASGIESAVMRIDHREPAFRCSATWVADGKTVLEYSFELLADGSETVGENDRSRLYWDGDALTSEFLTGTPDPVFAMTWRYEMIDDRGRLRATEQIRGSGRDQDNVWEFVRR
jgi:hypothetical protein